MLKKLLGMLSFFLLSIQGVMAASLSEFFTRKNFLEFVTDELGWMDWIVYFILLITVTIILKDIGLRNLHALNPRARTFIALVISFMSVTGLMWTFVQNEIFPHYFILFAGELLVLSVAVLIAVWAFKFKNSSNDNVKLAIRIAGVLLAFLILNSYHMMLADSKNGDITNALGIDSVSSPTSGISQSASTLLGEIALIHLDLPLWAYFFVFGLLFFLLYQEDNEKNGATGTKKKKENDPNVESAQQLTKEFSKELKELGDLFNEKSQILNQLRGQVQQVVSAPRTEANQQTATQQQGGNS